MRGGGGGYIPTDLPHDQGIVVAIIASAIVIGVVVHMFRRRK
ncbi:MULTISPECIES: hypothetical protein [unclassified Streptomyces]|nr:MULTISPECIES: hypothetical protein [unclassified Streptomyces]